jgi:hypothetical protein
VIQAGAMLSTDSISRQVGVASKDNDGRFRQVDEAEIERHLVAISERD